MLSPSNVKGQRAYSGRLAALPTDTIVNDHSSTSKEGLEGFHGPVDGYVNEESDSMVNGTVTQVDESEGVAEGSKAICLGVFGANRVGDEWEIIHKPDSIPPSPTSPLSLPAAPLATKHPFSAVDDTKADEMDQTSSSKPSTSSKLLSHEPSASSQASSSSTSKRGRTTGAIALTNIGHTLTDFNTSYRRGLEMEAAQLKMEAVQLKIEEARRKDRLEIESIRHQDRVAKQQTRAILAEQQTRALRAEQEDVVGQALARVQELETNLPPLHLAVIYEVLEDPIKAKAYLLIKRDDLREAWVGRRLKEKGMALPAGPTSDSMDVAAAV